MLSVTVRADNCSFSTPANYWLSHVEGLREGSAEEKQTRLDLKVLRCTQMKRLRYAQSHCWIVRLCHFFLELVEHRRHAPMLSY